MEHGTRHEQIELDCLFILFWRERREILEKKKEKKKSNVHNQYKKFLLYERFWLAGCFLFDDLKGRESSYIIYKNKAYLIYFVKQ